MLSLTVTSKPASEILVIVHVTVEPFLMLSISVDALDLSERPMNCLGRENITTVGQILEYTEDDLLNLTNFGQKSLDELVAKLDELGLSLPTSSDLDSEENADA